MNSNTLKPMLPQRRYFRLDDAAKELGCSVEDLIHWGGHRDISIGILIEELSYANSLSAYSGNIYGCWDDILTFDENSNSHHYRTNLSSLIHYKEREKVYIEGLWFLSAQDVSNIECYGALYPNKQELDHAISILLHTGNDSQIVSVRDFRICKPIDPSCLYVSGEQVMRLLSGDPQNSIDKQEPKLPNIHTKQDRWLDVIGAMTVLLYESEAKKYRKGENNLNVSGIAEAIKNRLQKEDLNLSDERLTNINKDIGAAIKVEPFNSFFRK